MSASCHLAPDPRSAYLDRRADRAGMALAFGLRERLYGNARVVAFLVILLVGFLAFGPGYLSAWWLLPLVAGFVALLFAHEAATRAWWRARQAVAYYESGLARLDHRWQGKGRQGARFVEADHPFAADFDLFGPGSLFELLCTARTRTGEDTLADWLKRGATPDVVRARQEAVAELRALPDLREDLALLGGDVPTGVDFSAVVAWGRAPVRLRPMWLRWVALVLGIATVACFLGWMATFSPGMFSPDSAVGAFFLRWGSLPFVALLAAEGIFVAPLLPGVNAALGDIEKRGRDLAMLSGVLARLEEATFASPHLRHLHSGLSSEDRKPSQCVAELTNLIDVLASRRNQLFAPFAYLLMIGTQIAFAVERRRGRFGPKIGEWLHIVGEFEALCALAAYSFENPQDPFPEILDRGPRYEAAALAHPLLPRENAVANDVDLGGEVKVLIVSGSNMSGKSTYLRTLGVNAVLALAGAPVRAAKMRISALALGATLRVQDSLQEGKSRFYAELLRVRQVVELSRGALPLLFMLDEIFAGTNSHDRCVGAEAVVLGLARRGAIGLVTTHDLTLTRIAEAMGSAARNVHFADDFREGAMHFDYRLKEGIVTNSNALALMRSVGLEVEEETAGVG